MTNDQQGRDSQTIKLRSIGHVERDEGDEGLVGKDLRARPARVVLNPAVTDGLLGLESGDDIVVLCYFHRAERDVLQVHPMGDLSRPLRGVFATRSPARPNPIAVTSAHVERIADNLLHVVGLDAVDRTPVLDIKSYAEAFDTPYR
ncbi:MAG: tRNA (N6-threonylcarbamoyladenosine(37)-N6)-methyltransferase TrmO [Anaerolineae bacterium]|jgi:tRNA-Thr(GGU) m(6)t(6)A37 methyltransferase TsaA